MFRSCLCGFVLTVLISVSFVFAIPSEFTKSPIFVFASSNNEDSQDENAGNDQPDGSSIEQQEQGTIGSSGDETDTTDDGSGVASEQDNACPAVAFEGPSYIGENGCPVPCPKDDQDSVPEGCPPPQQQPQQPLEQSTTPPTPTDDIAGTIQQEEGGAGLEPDESITFAPPEQTPSDLAKPLTIISEEGLCDDQIDNDGDGKTDFQDFDCNHGIGLGGPFPSEICDDGKDNDRDGAFDMDDRDCFRMVQPPLPGQDLSRSLKLDIETLCEDQIDNDRDGATDQQDSDCSATGFDTTSGKVFLTPEVICDDSIDNDRDGATDMDDIDCTRVITPTENRTVGAGETGDIHNVETEQGLCEDDTDNDNDGLIDAKDTIDCPPLSESRPPGFDPFGP